MKRRDWIILGRILTLVVFFTVFVAWITSFRCSEFKIETDNDWIGYYGAILGGLLTLAGVYITIRDNKVGQEEDFRKSIIPIFFVKTKHNADVGFGDSFPIDTGNDLTTEMFYFQLKNIGLKAAKDFKFSIQPKNQSKREWGKEILIPVGEMYEANVGVSVKDLRYTEIKSNYEICVSWRYKDLVGHEYCQKCDIILKPDPNNDGCTYVAEFGELEEAVYCGK